MLRIRPLLQKLWLLTGCLSVLPAIKFAEDRQAQRVIKALDIHIIHQDGYTLLSKEEVIECLQRANLGVVQANLIQISLPAIEQAIRANHFVKEAHAYKSWAQRLSVEVVPKKLLARCIYPDGRSMYMDETGELVPRSPNQAARLLVVTGTPLARIQSPLEPTLYRKQFLALLRFIHGHPFWRAQIVQITIAPNGELTLETQIEQHEVLFGLPDAISAKFGKLSVFYERILPHKGWGYYQRVNLKFAHQIVCE